MTNAHQLPITVFAVLINEMDEVLMMRRANTGFGDGHYALPGGHVEKDERIPDAAKREVLEETGLELQHVRIAGTVHSNVDREYLHFVAVATHRDWSGTPQNTEPNQCDDMKWVAWGDWPPNTLPCIRLALDNLSNNEFFGEYFTTKIQQDPSV